jgi:hypothetical protein
VPIVAMRRDRAWPHALPRLFAGQAAACALHRG